jgi:hypothetical protein
MFDHPVLTDESFATDFTREWFFSSVQTHVPPEIGLVVELLGTDLALVGLITGVFGEVLLKEEEKEIVRNKFHEINFSALLQIARLNNPPEKKTSTLDQSFEFLGREK